MKAQLEKNEGKKTPAKAVAAAPADQAADAQALAQDDNLDVSQLNPQQIAQAQADA